MIYGWFCLEDLNEKQGKEKTEMDNKTAQTAILLATYNGEKYLSELLDSLLAQTYEDYICYIHDDGSTDSTGTIIQTYSTDYPGRFIILDGPPTGGAKNNFFYMMKTAAGKHRYYMFCDQDDIWIPTKIEKSVEAIEKLEGQNNKNSKEPCLVFGDMKVVDETLSETADSFTRFNDLHYNRITLDRAVMKDCAAGCSMIFNNVLLQVVIVEDINSIIMHDAWVMILAAALGRIQYIDEPLTLYRQHKDNKVGAKHITKMSKILLRVKRVINFSQFSITRKGLYERIEQFRCCTYVNEFADQYPELTSDLKRFPEMRKPDRCKFVLKYHLYQNKWSSIWTCICS